jgi:glutamate-1-semialdehyde 2,1-aminomutase
LGSIEKKFRERTPKSAELTRRAAKVMPGGETRSAAYHSPYSVVVDHGEGCRVYDVDGNDYLDLSNNYTCLVHGHAYPPVVEAVGEAIKKGTTWAAKAIPQIELAELLVERVASVDEVRYANSGGEAVQNALLISRGYNGRSKILISNYSFHGHFLDIYGYAGRERNDAKPPTFVDTYVAEWDNAESFEAVLAEHGDEITAVLLEPWLGAGGTTCLAPSPGIRSRRLRATWRSVTSPPRRSTTWPGRWRRSRTACGQRVRRTESRSAAAGWVRS